ncbi:phosphatase PAP2 family protein [Halalkalibacter nanhaiisediminis]|uniref:PAP2 superfamily protein n=1 Tax=Halalkalibacter nanhaiisediminis TaxID=688079 RepID=A0A562QCN7_9BACI|nr:phosphatase PAP2 family protein [Halalkalibacter nanhaiisediminis]TWI54508.1 PAP2 superfamily protein [Halalkalibacter nanhaiisediminis]
MRNKPIISTFLAVLFLFILSGCNLEQVNSEEQPENKEQGNEQTSHQGMRWTHENPVTPTAGSWRALEFKDGSSYKVEAPPANDSAETKKELEDLKKLIESRTEEDVEFIMHWQNTTSPNTLWLATTEELIHKYGLMGPESARVHAVVSGATYTSLTATFQAKYEYLRPRPTDLDPSIKLPEGMMVPPHPAYPSGHTATAWTAAYILSYFFPNEKAQLEKTAEKVALSREQMGIHFKSDNDAAKTIAQAVTKDIIGSLKDDNAPTQYTEVKNTGSSHGAGH